MANCSSRLGGPPVGHKLHCLTSTSRYLRQELLDALQAGSFHLARGSEPCIWRLDNTQPRNHVLLDYLHRECDEVNTDSVLGIRSFCERIQIAGDSSELVQMAFGDHHESVSVEPDGIGEASR